MILQEKSRRLCAFSPKWLRKRDCCTWGAFHYVKPTGHRSVGIPEENGTTFSIKPGQPIGMALVAFYSFSEFLHQGKEPVCQKWNGEFRSEYSNRNKWTTSRGDPEYSDRKKPKRTFPFEFRPKFPESLA